MPNQSYSTLISYVEDHAGHDRRYAINATKKSNELMAHTYSHLYGIKTTGLRFFTVYGPWGRPDMSPMLFADAITHNRPIKVFNHGDMSRDFTYIDDIVDGIVNVIDGQVNPVIPSEASVIPCYDTESNSNLYRIYNIGNNTPVQLLDFIGTIEKAFDKTAEKIFMEMQPGDVKSTFADVDDLINDFDYKPNTALADGIGEFAAWYRELYGASK
jgi:UDP-glucuronate 4-epimerase